ncbi:uncharacterized protein LOC131949812 [Physella acuta]|uniref:uncharacterized protein LOC131949812 n=1 Tax=Physella acuta TaxID=109671 RepID=UPI0027DD92CA|nr:uncharacterized protein LOC131949812 [Physella acuta]XP_059167780.1 uncharacterized protein LOC131949812 [Physella acuta]XP_059167781.1 uncharacterized protein LOC131949812 [Physella acuta]
MEERVHTEEWTGTLQEDFSLSSHRMINFSTALYHPWGSQTGSAVAAILYTAWISGANLFLIFLLMTNVKLLNSRQNIVLLHYAVSDLTVGVFYCPLTADFFLRGHWAHGCSSFFVWFTFVFPLTFLTSHSVLLILTMRILPPCFRRYGLVVKTVARNCVFAASFVVLWAYLVAIGAALSAGRHDSVHIAIAPQVICKALVATKGAVIINVLVYFLPAGLSLLLLLAVAIREKTMMTTPTVQLHLEVNTEQCTDLPLHVLTLITVLTTILPLPAFLISTVMARGACSSVDCIAWLLPLGTVSDWLLFAKSGVVPVAIFMAPDFRSAVIGALHHFRRVPTSDTRDLVSNIEDPEDDTPFSNI